MLVGQILLALAAAFSLPLGARDGRGVSSILPPLRSALLGVEASSSARSHRSSDRSASGHHAESRRVVRRPLPPRRLVSQAVPLLRPSEDEVPDARHAEPRQSRAPPLLR